MDERRLMDLERRVQAHEALLAELIAGVGRQHPAILAKLEAIFSEHRPRPDQHYADTVAHAGQIVRIARRHTEAGEKAEP